MPLEAPDFRQSRRNDRWVRWGGSALETTLGLAFVWALAYSFDWHSFDGSMFVVAMVAARWGYGSGVIAGILAALPLLWAHGHTPAAYLDVNGARMGLAESFVPVALGALVGLIGEGHLKAVDAAGRERDAAVTRRQEMQEHFDLLMAAKEAQDRRIVGQTQSLGALYDAAKDLDVTDPDAVAPAALRLVERFIEADAAAIYALNDGALTLQATIGEAIERPETLQAQRGALADVVLTRTPLAVRTRADYEQAGILLAVPLVTGPDVRSVLVVERLPFARLTDVTLQLLEIIADWAGRALEKAEAFVAAREAQFVDPDTGIHRAAYTEERLHQEWALARRYSLPLSVVLIRSADVARAKPGDQRRVQQEVAAALLRRVRNIDLVGHYRTQDSFLLLLPVTPASGARILADRLAAELPGALAVDVGGNETADAPEAMLQQLQAGLFAEV